MSRSQAKRTFTTVDPATQTAGVVDEIPGAYKDLSQVIAEQRDLVDVVAHLKQVICVKG